MEQNIFAIINIGSSSIKMTIYQINNQSISIIDELRQHIMLGKDSFFNIIKDYCQKDLQL